MNFSDPERKLPIAQTIPHNASETPSQAVIQYSFELPPVHPKCRVFESEQIKAYAQKLLAKGEDVALRQLRDALVKAASQPPQGAWHEVKTGMAGNCRILHVGHVLAHGWTLMGKLKGSFCLCADCAKNRRNS